MGAFHIPPDFDDSALNIGFGSMLSQQANKLPFQMWKENNANFTHMFQALKKYAYRPFNRGREEATIDPRTYFAMREFLHSIAEDGHPAAFVVTWMHSIHEDNITRYSIAMPFHVNNVDLTIGTNTLYAITSALLTHIADSQEWFDEDLQMIYENTTNLIAWMVERNFSSRPDIILTYYPSLYNFFWFTARNLNLLRTYAVKDPLPYPVLTRTMDTLENLMQGTVTRFILNKAITSEDGLVYFEEFLGNDDVNILGKNSKV